MTCGSVSPFHWAIATPSTLIPFAELLVDSPSLLPYLHIFLILRVLLFSKFRIPKPESEHPCVATLTMLRYFQKPAAATPSETPASTEEQTAESHDVASRAVQTATPSDAEALDPTLTSASKAASSDQEPADEADGPGKPVISDEDELFLLKVASEGEPPPLPPRPQSSTGGASSGGTQKTEGEGGIVKETADGSASIEEPSPSSKHWTERWVDWGLKPQSDRALEGLRQLAEARQVASVRRARSQERTQAADALQSAADEVKKRSQESTGETEAKEEQNQVSSILKGLDLSSINNRVVGVSKETQKLLESFNQVLKDIVNGVPTAYDDLEKLLTDRQKQLDRLYSGLPPFLQSLVKTIPVKVWAAMAPQVAAAMATESKDEGSKEADGKKKKSKGVIPSLKSLIGQKGAVIGMLRSIITFLEARFPALLAGTNVIVSLAVFILLFVFWYCHKRGRETRLATAEAEAVSDDDSLFDLEKGTNLEDTESRAANISQPGEMKALPETDDADIEKNVDVLMQQLGQPTREVPAPVTPAT